MTNSNLLRPKVAGLFSGFFCGLRLQAALAAAIFLALFGIGLAPRAHAVTYQTVARGGTASFSVSPGALAYQWQKDGVDLPGQTQSTLTIPNVQPPSIGFYNCKITSNSGTVSSGQEGLQIPGVPFGDWQGLVAFYPFDGNAADASGFGNDGVVVGAQSAPNRFGAPNEAFRFTGTSTYVAYPDSVFGPSTPEFTWSVWAKPEPGLVGTDGEAFVMNHGANNGEAALYWTGTGYSFWGKFAISDSFEAPAACGTGWKHLVCVYRRGAAMELWINGQLSASIVPPIEDLYSCPGFQSSIGLYRSSYGPYRLAFGGLIDDVRIYNRALTATDIQQLYASESTVAYENDPAGSGQILQPTERDSTLAATNGSGSALPGEPAGTTLTKVGIPSLRNGSWKAFSAVLKTPQGRVNAVISGTAVLSGTEERILVRQGDAAPDEAGNPMVGSEQALTFKAFEDPIINDVGCTAFLATLEGTVASEKGHAGLWTNAFGPLDLVVREGKSAPGIAGAKVHRINSMALSDGAGGMLAFTARLSNSTGGVNANTDQALWAVTASGTSVLLREGSMVMINGQQMKVKQFTALGVVAGSPGQHRSIAANWVVAQVYFTNRLEAVLVLTPGQAPQVAGLKGQPLLGAPNGTLAERFGAPSLPASGQVGGKVRLLKGVGGVNSANAEAILVGGTQGDYAQMVARQNELAPDAVGSLMPNARFKQLNDPVVNAQGFCAFTAVMTGKGVSNGNNLGLWWGKPGSVRLVVREGDSAPGSDGTFASFTSLALPDDASAVSPIGPVFMAKVKGAKAITGLYALNSHGVLQLVARTGATAEVNGKPFEIAEITALEAVPGSPAQGRSYNAERMVIYRLGFRGGYQKIVETEIP